MLAGLLHTTVAPSTSWLLLLYEPFSLCDPERTMTILLLLTACLQTLLLCATGTENEEIASQSDLRIAVCPSSYGT